MPPTGPLSLGIRPGIARPLERLLGIDRLNAIHARCAGAADARAFLRRVLDDVGVRFRVPQADLERVPRHGPLVVVSNHPFGALDGIVLAALLLEVRPDVKVLANHLLGRLADLRELFIFVNPFGGSRAASANLGPVRQSVAWLKSGGALAIFPAGEVAHLRWRDLQPAALRSRMRSVTDAAWNDTAARIAARAQAPVLPVYFEGTNTPLFHALGLIHPRLRTLMLGREFLNKRDGVIDIRIGSPISARRISAIPDDAERTAYLRGRTFLLRHTARTARPDAGPAPVDVGVSPPRRQVGEAIPRATVAPAAAATAATTAATMEPVVGAVDLVLLAADVASLPADAALVDSDEFVVLHARAPQIRNLLREIGRLREVTFRAVGEGTGRSIDLDTFDYDYIHLFVWNRAKGEVVGAYRLGPTDELLAAKGRQGLYTSTLFDYKPGVLERMSPALEMGRSFVRAEYQKSYAPLLLLWKGIGHYVVRHPRYRHLVGPVSISNSYQTVSRQLMVQFLRLHHGVPGGDGLVEPREPFRVRPLPGWDQDVARALAQEREDVSDFVADLEPDGKGVPVLVRQYLKLGAKFLAFNVDASFGDALDGLIVVDLMNTVPRVLERYMGREGYQAFRSVHAAKAGREAGQGPGQRQVAGATA